MPVRNKCFTDIYRPKIGNKRLNLSDMCQWIAALKYTSAHKYRPWISVLLEVIELKLCGNIELNECRSASKSRSDCTTSSKSWFEIDVRESSVISDGDDSVFSKNEHACMNELYGSNINSSWGCLWTDRHLMLLRWKRKNSFRDNLPFQSDTIHLLQVTMKPCYRKICFVFSKDLFQ